MAAPEDWLRQQLLALSKQGGTALDEEMVHGLADYCARATDEDAAEYIKNFVGEQAQGIVDVYQAKRRSAGGPSSSSVGAASNGQKTGPPATDQSQSGGSLQAYIKPSLEPGGVSAAKKVGKKGRVAEENKASVGDSEAGPRLEPPGASEGFTSLGKVGRKKKNKAGQVRVEDVAAGRVLLAHRKLCDCQARRHRLITNCLSCGRIVCEQEGEGPCMYCGAMVSREGGELAPPVTGGETDEQLAAKLEAEEKARAFKDRLVEYDRSAAQRTAVIDDQSDFFHMDVDGDAWMSEEEKQKLRVQKALAAHAEREKRSRVQVTFDLIGRKVIMAGDETDESSAGVSSGATPPGSSGSAGPNPLSRIIPNPMLKGPLPIFVDTPVQTANGSGSTQAGGSPSGGSSEGGPETAARQPKQPPAGKKLLLGTTAKSGRLERVQHDSSYFGAVESQLGGASGADREAGGASTAAEQEMSETVRLSGRDVDVEEFGSEPACGSSIPQFGKPIGKGNL